MALELVGTLYEIFDEQQITPTFKKKEFVLEVVDESPTGMTFTNYASFQLINNSCGLIDNFEKGEKVKVSFNVRGNKWERDGVVRYITNLNAWRVERVDGSSSSGGYDGYADIPQASAPNQANTPSFTNQPPRGMDANNLDEPSDDLPF